MLKVFRRSISEASREFALLAGGITDSETNGEAAPATGFSFRQGEAHGGYTQGTRLKGDDEAFAFSEGFL